MTDLVKKLSEATTVKVNEAYNFFVQAGGGVTEPYADKTFADPEKAIEQWFKWQKVRGLDVWISASVEDGEVLLAWAKANKDKIRAIASKYEHPYNIDLWLDNIDTGYVDTTEIDAGFLAGTVSPFEGG